MSGFNLILRTRGCSPNPVHVGHAGALIGRGGDVVLCDPEVSTVHGELRLSGDRVLYRDLGSTNGSFLSDGSSVTGAIPLVIGDSIHLGNSIVTLSGIGAEQLGERRHTHRRPVPVRASRPARGAWWRGWQLVAANLYLLLPLGLLLFGLLLVGGRFGWKSIQFISVAWPTVLALPFAIAIAWAGFVESAHGRRLSFAKAVRLVCDRLANVYLTTSIAIGAWIPLGFFVPAILFEEDRSYTENNARSVELVRHCGGRVAAVFAIGLVTVAAAVALDFAVAMLAAGDGFTSIWRAGAVALIVGWLGASSVVVYVEQARALESVADGWQTVRRSAPRPPPAAPRPPGRSRSVNGRTADQAMTVLDLAEHRSPPPPPRAQSMPLWRPPPVLRPRRLSHHGIDALFDDDTDGGGCDAMDDLYERTNVRRSASQPKPHSRANLPLPGAMLRPKY